MSRTKKSPARVHRLSRQSGAPVVPCYKAGAHGAWRRIPCRVPRKLPSPLEGTYSITRTSFMPEVFLKLRNFNKSTETLVKMIHACMARSSRSSKLPEGTVTQGTATLLPWPWHPGGPSRGVPQGVPPGGRQVLVGQASWGTLSEGFVKYSGENSEACRIAF